MPLTDPDFVYFTAKQVRVRFGNVSDVTLHRWLKDPAKEFPRPIYIGERRYWKLADIEAFEERLRTTGGRPRLAVTRLRLAASRRPRGPNELWPPETRSRRGGHRTGLQNV